MIAGEYIDTELEGKKIKDKKLRYQELANRSLKDIEKDFNN